MPFKVSTNDHHSLNYSEQDSGELFSDDDKNERNITSRTPNTSKANDLSLLNLTEVSSMIENVGAPIIPSTPISLVPFISKNNDLWTSDLETPQADKKAQFAVEKSLVSSNEKSIIIKQATPTLLNTENELTSNSPVINCKKIRKRTKRRIFPLSINRDSLSLSTIEMESKGSVSPVENSRSQQEDKTTVITETQKNVLTKIHEVTSNNTNQIIAHELGESLTTLTPDFHDLDKCSNPLQEEKRENDVDFTDKIPNDSKPDSQSDKISTQSSGVLMDLFYQLDIENPQKLIFNNDLITDKRVEVPPTIEKKHWILDEIKQEEKELFIDKLEDAFFDDKNDPLMSIQDNISQEVLENKNIPKPNYSEGMVLKKNFSIVREKENYEALKKVGGLLSTGCHDINKEGNKSSTSIAKTTSVGIRNSDQIKNQNPSMTNFSTARGSSVFVSNNALYRARNLFADELQEQMIVDTEKTNSESMSKTPLKFIHPSHESSTKSLNMIEYNKPSKSIVNINHQGEKRKPSTLFSTASGKSIQISDNALTKANNLFANDLQEGTIMETNEENSKPKYNETVKSIPVPNTHQNKEESQVSTLFSTASGKSIPISNNALTKANNLFANDIDTNDTPNTIRISNTYQNREKNQISSLFSTASGQSINIPESALIKAKTVFGNELQEGMTIDTSEKNSVPKYNDSLKSTRVSNIHQNREKSRTSTLFSTAKGQSIKISENALTKANNLLSNELQEGMAMDTNDTVETKLVPIIHKNQEKSKASTLFSTAKGQSIHIPDNALSAAKNLFANDLQDQTNMDINNQESEPLVKTVSKIPQSISNSTPIFKSILNSTPVNIQHNNQIGTKKRSLSLFSTASGGSVHVSDDALNQAKDLFGDELKSETVTPVARPSHKYNRTLLKLSIDQETTSTPTIRTASEEIPLLKNSSKFRKHVSASALGSNKYKSHGSRRYSIPLETKHRLDEFSNENIIQNQDFNIKKDEIYIHTKIEDDSTISDEIFASAAALLADEKDEEDNINNKWNNPETSGANVVESISNIPSSPILGRRDSLCIRKRGKRSLESVSKRIKIIDDHAVDGKDKTSCESQKSDSNNFADDQLFMDFINESTVILQQRNLAVLEQERLIGDKRKNRPKPTTGRLLSFKKDHSKKHLSWKDISNGCAPVPYVTQELSHNSIPINIWEITSTAAPSYRFRFTDFYEERIVQYNVNGIKVGDGVSVILDQHGCAGVEEFKRAFLTNPGVDLTILPENWVVNHYRWIVWKLASMDRMKFGRACLPRALTPDRVMYQLKYRYDREIDRSERSALRRILEKDDPSSKRMILCVSSIVDSKLTDCANKNSKLSQWKILLTDGWYSVPASIDSAMTNYVTSGKIQEGTKIITSGAELLNCSKGCSPLEISNDISLKIHTNSTRRVRWDTKLGFTSRTNPIPISLKSVCPHGGLIGKLKVVVSRVYPVIYHEKTSTGESIFRNSRSEEKANAAYEQDCRSKMETFYAEAENQFNGPHKSSLDSEDMDVEGSYEQHSYMNRVKKKQQEFQEKFQSKLRESLPSPRQVSQVLKVRIFQNETTAILTIWSPNEEIIDMMKEGQSITICNISASGKRGNELQITANRNTLYHKIGIRNSTYPTRQFISIHDVNPGFDPLYGEFDTVGIVVSSGAIVYNNFECVNIAYRTLDSDKPSYLSILFWQSISAYGYLEILTVGSFIGCCNLEWRKNSSSSITFAYCTERTIFTRNPRQEHLKSPFDELKRSINDPQTFSIQCAREINIELEKSTMKKISNNQTPDRTISSFAMKSSANHQSNHWNPVNKTNNDSFNSPSVQKRIAKLSYGDAPRLPPLAIINSSKRVCLDFQSPIRKSETGKPKNSS